MSDWHARLKLLEQEAPYEVGTSLYDYLDAREWETLVEFEEGGIDRRRKRIPVKYVPSTYTRHTWRVQTWKLQL